MATYRNLFRNYGGFKRTVYLIAGFAVSGLLTGLVVGAATLIVANLLG